MIVQTAPGGAPHFVMRMSEHTGLSDQFAEAFGNSDFEPVEDEASRYIIANHDAGWQISMRSSASIRTRAILTISPKHGSS